MTGSLASTRRILVGLALVIAASFFPCSAWAQSESRWSAVDNENWCDIRYYRGETLVFMLRYMGPQAYSISGEATRMPDTGEDVSGEIRVIAGEQEVLLNGAAQAMSEQTRRTRQHPIVFFFSAIEGAESFDLVTEAGRRTISLAWIEGKVSQFNSCSAALNSASGPRDPILISFEGQHQLLAAANRQRMLSQTLGFTLTVTPEGEPVDCKLSRDFRRRATEIALCRPLLRFMRFDPAIDSQGRPVEGQYTSEIDFRMWMTQNGHLEERFRN